jgi:hypothetical protein
VHVVKGFRRIQLHNLGSYEVGIVYIVFDYTKVESYSHFLLFLKFDIIEFTALDMVEVLHLE